MQPIEASAGRTPETNRTFWDRYVAHMQAQGVKPTVVRWYVIRAEQYIRTVSQQRLADHTPQDVTVYLEKLGRSRSLTDWHYRQTVEAIRQVLLLAKVAWAQQFDWAYWKASARTLPGNHPTLAREVAPTTRMGNEAPTQTPNGRPVTGHHDLQAAWRSGRVMRCQRFFTRAAPQPPTPASQSTAPSKPHRVTPTQYLPVQHS